MPHKRAQDALKKCLNDAKTGADKAACLTKFGAAVGVAPQGGKVFETPDGEATFVTTGGKVFGGKVF